MYQEGLETCNDSIKMLILLLCISIRQHKDIELQLLDYKYRLYTEVKVSTRFIKPRAFGPWFDKSSRDRTEVYNALLPCYQRISFVRNTVTKQIFARGNSIYNLDQV